MSVADDRNLGLHVYTMKQIQVVARARLKPGTAGLRVRNADYSSTLTPGSFIDSNEVIYFVK